MPNNRNGLIIGLHSQSLNSPDGFVAGSEVTTNGLMRALLRNERVADVKRYGPGNYANLPQDHLDLLVIEGWHKNVPEVINAVRCKNSECIILFWNLSFYGFDEIIRFDVDGYLTNSYKTLEYLSKIKPTIFLMLAADPDEFAPGEVVPEYAHDVVYLGINHPNKSDKVLEMMLYEATRFDFALYGKGWGGHPALAPFWMGLLPKDDITKLYSSAKVVIGTTEDRQRAAGMINNRAFEALSCGSCFVSEYFPELESVFGDAILYSHSSGDTHLNISRLLTDHDFAAALRNKGRQCIVQGHTYNHRIIDILKFYDQLFIERLERPLSRNEQAFQHLKKAFVLLREKYFMEAQEEVRQYIELIDYNTLQCTDNRTTSEPVVSVIVVTHQSDKKLLQCIDSVTTSTNQASCEIIVVDNGGNNDILPELLQRSVLYIKVGFNVLAAEGRNIGVHFAKAPLVAFMDDDAVAGQGYFEAIVDAFSRYTIHALRGKVLQDASHPQQDESSHYDLGPVPFPAMLDVEGNCAIKTDTWRRLGGQDPLLFGNEGKELTYRLLTAATDSMYPTMYWPKAVIFHNYAATPAKAKVKTKRHALMESYTGYKHPQWNFFLKQHLFFAKDMSARCTGNELLELFNNASPHQRTDYDGTGPFFSICMPAYNSAETISEAIKSVLHQTYRNFEIVVVDDGSTDRTATIIYEMQSSKIRCIAKEHSGAPATRNRCIAEARADFIVWLDADDLMLPRTLERYAYCLQQTPMLDVLYGGLSTFDTEQQQTEVWKYYDYCHWPGALRAEMMLQDPIPNVCVCIRKSCYEKVGKYREDFPRAHDYEFFARLAPVARFRHVGRIVGRYRSHQSSLSKNSLLLQKAFEARIVKTLLASHDLQTLFPYCFYKGAPIQRSKAHAWRLAALVMLKWGDPEAALEYVQRSVESESLLENTRLAWLLTDIYGRQMQAAPNQQAAYPGLYDDDELGGVIKAAVYLLRTGNLAGCSEYCEQLLKRQPEGLETFLLTALCLTAAGDYKNARIAFQSLIDTQVSLAFTDATSFSPDLDEPRSLDWYHEKLCEVLGELTPRFAITTFVNCWA